MQLVTITHLDFGGKWAEFQSNICRKWQPKMGWEQKVSPLILFIDIVGYRQDLSTTSGDLWKVRNRF